jgi:hypothetical protein
MHRLGSFFAILAVFAVTAAILLFTTSGGGIGAGARPRSAKERSAMISDGNCAVRHNGAVVGRVVGELGPSRGSPRLRYQIVEIERHRAVQVYANEVRLVPCTSLR